jgi:hypothetical protein
MSARLRPARHRCRFHCPGPSRRGWGFGLGYGTGHRTQDTGHRRKGQRRARQDTAGLLTCTALQSSSMPHDAKLVPATLSRAAEYLRCGRGVLRRRGGEARGKSAASKHAGTVDPGEGRVPHCPQLRPLGRACQVRVLALCNRCSHRRLGVSIFHWVIGFMAPSWQGHALARKTLLRRRSGPASISPRCCRCTWSVLHQA